jgi:hypothetical protein
MLTYSFLTVYFYGTYVGLEKYLPQYFPESGNIVTRKYRIVNSVKSLALAGLCIPGTQFVYNLMYYPEALTFNQLDWIGAVYTATDASALLYNRNCHQSTLIHHIVVQLFYYYCYMSNFDMNQGACRAIALYCIYSAAAFLVNMRLAIRFSPYPMIEHYVNEAALYMYITSCTINWATQSYLLLGGLEMFYLVRAIYALALAMTIRDDLFLIHFLRKIDYIKNE